MKVCEYYKELFEDFPQCLGNLPDNRDKAESTQKGHTIG